MAKKSGMSIGPDSILQACVAVFFIVAGILGIQAYNSNLSGVMRFLGRHDTLTIVVAIVELVIGIVLGLAFFVRIPSSIAGILALVFPVLWAVWIVLAWFGRDAFKPDFLSWLNGFVRDLIILVALWISSRRLGGGN
ncbi:MAG TPA: hypothetical protein VMV83_17130 [Rectinemataceae bacterium]|nr:hypothetical protein [Rectinemataceae bacterium]